MKSPNFGPRRNGLRPTLVVLHYTAMRDCDAAARALCDPAREVSAHYLIGRDGRVIALVDEAMRAWHAGAGTWRGAGDVNSRSIGIELDNDGQSPFPEPLMRALEGLLPGILERWGIAPEGVIGHSDMAPGRKTDPGARFDWRRLALGGMSVWPGVSAEAGPGAGPGAGSGAGCGAGSGAPDPARFRADATAFGYGEMPFDLLLSVVRLRFRPWARGPLAGADCAAMADLAARFGA